jgi:hypothetical protein
MEVQRVRLGIRGYDGVARYQSVVLIDAVVSRCEVSEQMKADALIRTI